MKVTNLIEKLERVSNKIEDALFEAFGPNYLTQREIYRRHKQMASLNNSLNLSMSLLEGNLSANFIDQDTSVEPSMIDLNETRQFKKSNLSEIDLKKLVHIGGCRIEIGELVEILDKYLGKKTYNIEKPLLNYSPSKNENNQMNCTSPSPSKKDNDNNNSFIEGNSIYESPERNSSFLLAKEEYYDAIDTKEKFIECLKYPLSDTMLKKFKKISVLITNLIHQQKIFFNLSRRDENQDMNISHNNPVNKSVVYRRLSLLESSFINENEFNDFSNSVLKDRSFLILPEVKEYPASEVTENFFADKRKKKALRKKRNTLAGGRLCNKLRQLNKKLNIEIDNNHLSETAPRNQPSKEDLDDLSMSKKFLDSAKKNIKNYPVRKFVPAGGDFNESFSKIEGKEFGGISEVKEKRGSAFFDQNQFNEIKNFISNEKENNGEEVIKEKEIEEEMSSDKGEEVVSEDGSESNDEKEAKEEKKEEGEEKEEEEDPDEEEDVFAEKDKNEDNDEEEAVDDDDDDDESDDDDDSSERVEVNSSICFDQL